MASSTLPLTTTAELRLQRDAEARTGRISKALNVLLLLGIAASVAYMVHGRGGVAYLRSIGGATGVDPAYISRAAMFRTYAPKPGSIVMLGASLVAGCEWREQLGRDDVYNRGISGDTTAGVLARLDSVIAMKPRMVFLQAGSNDLRALISPDQTASNIREIANRLARAGIMVYVQTLLPSRTPRRNAHIERVNRYLRGTPRLLLIDLYPLFVDGVGMLREDLTTDGLHLTAGGYAIWQRAIEPLL